jgi:rhodanese-related sulfurtransferase
MARQTVHRVDSLELKDILNDPNKISNCQIVDVRESHELDISSIKNVGVIHLPLSTSSQWTTQIKDGHILDNKKPVIVLCRSGVRSLRIAKLLGMYMRILHDVNIFHLSYRHNLEIEYNIYQL